MGAAYNQFMGSLSSSIWTGILFGFSIKLSLNSFYVREVVQQTAGAIAVGNHGANEQYFNFYLSKFSIRGSAIEVQ